MTRRSKATSQAGQRPDLQARLTRDLARYERREQDASSFWRSLGVLGSVGWPIMLLAVGGALVGGWVDERWGTGTRYTLAFLLIGLAVGVAIAFNLVRPQRR